MKLPSASVPAIKLPERSSLLRLFGCVFMGLLILAGALHQAPSWVAVMAASIIIAVEAYHVWAQGEGFMDHLLQQSPYWLLSLSVFVVATHNPRLATQLVLVVGYIIWRYKLEKLLNDPEKALAIGAVTQFMSLSAIFLAAGVWRWSGLVVIVSAWVVSWLVAMNTLRLQGERAARALAATWALLVAECSWIFTLWLIIYILPGGFIILPQPALVLTALGYCLAGIYSSHRRSQLSRARLVEYLIVGLLLMSVVIAGTKWNGVI
jgi:hypothetical protein